MGTLGPEARNIGGGGRKSLASEGLFEAGEVRVDVSGELWKEFETPLNLMKKL